MRGHKGWPILVCVTCGVLAGSGLLLEYRNRSHSLNPNRLPRAIDAALRAGDLPQAERRLRALLEHRPADVEAHQMLAELYARAGRLSDALAEFKHVPPRHQLSPRARLEEGRVLLRLGRAGAAETALKQCIGEQADSVQARGLLAYIYQTELRYNEHKSVLDEMADLGVQLALSIRGVRPPMSPPLLKSILASDLLERDQPEDITQRVELVRHFLAAEPENRHAQLALARFSIMQGKLADARQLLASLRRQSPEHAPVLAAQLECELAAGDYDAARRILEHAPQLPADQPSFAILCGMLAQATGDNAAALDYFQKAVARQPLGRQGHYHLGRLLQILGRLDESRLELERVRQLDELENSLSELSAQPDNPELLARLARTCEALDQLQAAQACYEEILRIDASRSDAQQQLERLRGLAAHRPPDKP